MRDPQWVFDGPIQFRRVRRVLSMTSAPLTEEELDQFIAEVDQEEADWDAGDL